MTDWSEDAGAVYLSVGLVALQFLTHSAVFKSHLLTLPISAVPYLFQLDKVDETYHSRQNNPIQKHDTLNRAPCRQIAQANPHISENLARQT